MKQFVLLIVKKKLMAKLISVFLIKLNVYVNNKLFQQTHIGQAIKIGNLRNLKSGASNSRSLMLRKIGPRKDFGFKFPFAAIL